ncbi:MAG: arylsulfatase [Cyclobacteriaceae bacterium]
MSLKSYFLIFSIIGTQYMGCQSKKSPEIKQEKFPNIVLIVADDMGYGDPGCYNPESKIPTPNMDELSKRGVRYTDAHAAASVCTPARYGILTGRYCWRSRLKKGVLWSGYDDPLIPTERETLASLLKDHGYKTGVVGKWHLGMNFLRKDQISFVKPKDYHFSGLNGTRDVDFTKPIYNGPNYLGFDYALVSAGGHNMEPHCFIENDFTLGIPDIWREAKAPLWEGISASEVHEGWMVEGWDDRTVGPDLTESAKDFITQAHSENPDQPFFLYFPTVSPHRPCTPPDFIKGKSEAGERGDMVAEFDWSVGEIMKTLASLGIEENTLLIVTSDNGATQVSDDGKDYGHDSCGDLRGFKGGLYEGGHRVPFIVSWPNQLEAGTVEDRLVCQTDFYSTFSKIVGEPIKKSSGEDSFDFLFTGKNDPGARNSLIMQNYGGDFAIREGDWKLLLTGNPSIGENELYDLKNDPREAVNLVMDHPDKVNELTTLLIGQKLNWRSNEKLIDLTGGE